MDYVVNIEPISQFHLTYRAAPILERVELVAVGF